MMTSNLYTTTWRRSCNQNNSLAYKRCKLCGDSISRNVLEQIYKEEIHYQNIEHAEEEKKRKIILIVTACVCLFNAPLIFKLIVRVIIRLLFLIGTLSGMVCIINGGRRIRGINASHAKENSVIFAVSLLCFFIVIFGVGSWVNVSRIVLGIMTASWLLLAVIHIVKVAKRKNNHSIPADVVWCVVKMVLLALIFAKTMTI